MDDQLKRFSNAAKETAQELIEEVNKMQNSSDQRERRAH